MSLAVFLVIAAGLALFARNKQNEADSNSALAQSNYLRAETQRLAVLSNEIRLEGGSTEVSALLAIRSMRMQYSPEGDQALIRASMSDLPIRLMNKGSKSQSPLFSPDGKLLLTGGTDGVIHVWDVQSGTEVRKFIGHTDWSFAIRITPDSRYLLTISNDGTVRLWDFLSGKELKRFNGIGADLSPDGTHIVVSKDDQSVQLYDVASGMQLYNWTNLGETIQTVKFAPDGRTAVGFAGTIYVWDVDTGRQIRRFDTPWGISVVMGGAISPDGKLLATASWDNTTLMWNLTPPTDGATFPTTDEALLSPDGKRMITTVFNPDQTNSMALWDRQTGQQINKFATGASGRVFTPDGRYLVDVYFDHFVWIEDPLTGEEVRRYDLPWNAQYVDLSSDGTKILLGPNDQGADVKMLNFADGKELRSWTGQPGNNFLAVFSPDVKSIATGSSDRYIRTWNAQTGALLHQFDGGVGVETQALAFSPDNKTLAAAGDDDLIRLFDTQTGQPIRQLVGHTDQVINVNYSPDGRYILSSSLDGTARIWDAQTGEEKRRIVGMKGFGHLQFTPDGCEILLAGDDYYTHIWSVDYHEGIINLCKRLVRDFTDGERTLYNIPDKEPTCPQDSTIFGPTQTPVPVPTMPVWTPLPTVIIPTFPPEPTDMPTQDATQSATQSSGG